MKNEIEKQIFEKMKAKDFGESMCNETKLNVLKWTMQQLRIHAVSGSLPLTEEDIWDKIDWDMQQWGMGQGECESLLNEWKHRYKIALRNWFDEGNDR